MESKEPFSFANFLEEILKNLVDKNRASSTLKRDLPTLSPIPNAVQKSVAQCLAGLLRLLN